MGPAADNSDVAVVVMRPSLGDRIKRCTRPSVRPSVACVRVSRNRKAAQTSNLMEYSTGRDWGSKFEVWRSKIKVAGNENVKVVVGV